METVMSDILCAVCGEPWDAYGVHHGDMMAWEARLFKRGLGCPSCQGLAPDDLSPFRRLPGYTRSAREDLALESARSMNDNWDDPHSFEHLNDVLASAVTGESPTPKRIAWQPPERKLLWTCDGCKARAVRPLQFSLSEPNSDNEPEWEGGEKVHYRYGLAFARGDSLDKGECTEEPTHTIDGKHYCDLCAESCDECREVSIFSRSDLQGDSYDPGSSFQSGDWFGKAVCIDCSEKESDDEAQEREALEDEEE